MQAVRRLPGTIADAGDRLACDAGRMERHPLAVAEDAVARRHHAAHQHLQPLERGVDEARGAARAGLLAEHVPRLDRLAKLEHDAVARQRSDARKAKLELRREPLGPKREPGCGGLGDDVAQILPDEVR